MKIPHNHLKCILEYVATPLVNSATRRSRANPHWRYIIGVIRRNDLSNALYATEVFPQRTMIPVSKHVPARTNPSPRRVRSPHNPIPNTNRIRRDRPPEIVRNRNAGGGGLRSGRTGGGQEQEGGEG